MIAKVTQGSSYVDPSWTTFRDTAQAAGLILVGYHYVNTDPPTTQANLLTHLGQPVATILDFEAGSGKLDNLWAVADAISSGGGLVAMSYIPRWYGQIGSPDLTGVPGLAASDYVTGSGYARALPGTYDTKAQTT